MKKDGLAKRAATARGGGRMSRKWLMSVLVVVLLFTVAVLPVVVAQALSPTDVTFQGCFLSLSANKTPQYSGRYGRTNYPCNIGRHGVHQQIVTGILIVSYHLHHSCRVRHC